MAGSGMFCQDGTVPLRNVAAHWDENFWESGRVLAGRLADAVAPQ
jgi:hypothetical protein